MIGFFASDPTGVTTAAALLGVAAVALIAYLFRFGKTEGNMTSHRFRHRFRQGADSSLQTGNVLMLTSHLLLRTQAIAFGVRAASPLLKQLLQM